MTEIQKAWALIHPLIRRLLGRYYISPSPPAIFVFAPLHPQAKTLQKRNKGVTSKNKNVTDPRERYRNEVSDHSEHTEVIALWLKECLAS